MTPDDFAAAWEQFTPQLQSALHYGGGLYSLDDVRDRIEHPKPGAEAQFWANDTACAVTHFTYAPKVKGLFYWLLCGDTPGLKLLLPQIECWGIQNDCTRFEGVGRRGFEKRFEKYGYRPVAVHYVKDIMGMLQ